MKKSLFVYGLVIGLGIGVYYNCNNQKPNNKTQQDQQTNLDKQDQPNQLNQQNKNNPEQNNLSPLEIKIASFNIQVFGESKSKKKEIMDVLAKTIRNFDVVAIQEIRDDKNMALPYLIQIINETANSYAQKYNYIASPRLGRTNSKEQYAFIYNTSKIKPNGSNYVYNDISDVFEREPFITNFVSGKFDFSLVNIHTKPTDAKHEINALCDVVKDAVNRSPKNKDVIVLGDYNADGSYFSESAITGFRVAQYFLSIPDNFDTTVSENTNTYDRIVFQKQYTSEDFSGKVGVFRFDEEYHLSKQMAKQVSDHYPVWAVFYTDKDTD